MAHLRRENRAADDGGGKGQQRSLSAFLPRDTVRDAVAEIESHLRERIAGADASPNERVALEQILAALGPPLRVAQAYPRSGRLTRRSRPAGLSPCCARSRHMAVSTVSGFVVGLLVLVGYTVSAGFVIVAVMKPIFPANVGLHTVNGWPVALGAQFPAPTEPVGGGYWIIPIALTLGLGAFVITQKAARAFVARWRTRRQPALS